MPATDAAGKVTLTLHETSGTSPSVEILHFGATVVSWKSAAAHDASSVKERFFVSSKSALDGSKPVRGGIPVVFPFFGPPTRPEHASLPSHGFARSEKWTYSGVVFETDASIAARFVLEPSPSITTKWNIPFILEYIVTLTPHELSTALHVTNPEPSVSALHFQALLHNYILTAPAPTSSITISPLSNLTYIDKVKGGVESIEKRAHVDVKSFTDSVYKDAHGSGGYEVRWEGGGINLKTSGFKDVVVWNPAEEAGSKIADLEEGGWGKYVCVEPGSVNGFTTLSVGETWIGTQLFTPV